MRLISRSFEIIRQEGLRSFTCSAKTYVHHQLLGIKYSFGSGRVCSICGWEGSQFLPFGVEQRPDSACPKCGAKERHRLIWEYFVREFLNESHIDVLYFAPVDGLETKLKNQKSITVTTTDLIQSGVDVKADITQLPIADESFDVILCSHVLEHVPNDGLALEELYRVLQKNGVAIILVPQDRQRDETYQDLTITSDEARREAFGQRDHVRWYGRDVEEIISSTGFEVLTIDYTTKFDESYINKHRLRESDVWIHDSTQIFRCSKS